jgi:hypothetical protein
LIKRKLTGALSPNRGVVIKRKEFTIDEEHPKGTFKQTNMALDHPNAKDGALSPLQLEPNELTIYMRMRHDRRDER